MYVRNVMENYVLPLVNGNPEDNTWWCPRQETMEEEDPGSRPCKLAAGKGCGGDSKWVVKENKNTGI